MAIVHFATDTDRLFGWMSGKYIEVLAVFVDDREGQPAVGLGGVDLEAGTRGGKRVVELAADVDLQARPAAESLGRRAAEVPAH